MVWIRRNNKLYIGVLKKEFRNKVFLDIRYYAKKDDILVPLKKGIMIPEELFSDFLTAISDEIDKPPQQDIRIGDLEADILDNLFKGVEEKEEEED